jgi:hypothetical protein
MAMHLLPVVAPAQSAHVCPGSPHAWSPIGVQAPAPQQVFGPHVAQIGPAESSAEVSASAVPPPASGLPVTVATSSPMPPSASTENRSRVASLSTTAPPSLGASPKPDVASPHAPAATPASPIAQVTPSVRRIRQNVSYLGSACSDATSRRVMTAHPRGGRSAGDENSARPGARLAGGLAAASRALRLSSSHGRKPLSHPVTIVNVLSRAGRARLLAMRERDKMLRPAARCNRKGCSLHVKPEA